MPLAPGIFGPRVEPIIASTPPGGVVVLENLRFDPGEESCDPGFSANLCGGYDAYVNEAFGASHRAHASIVEPPATLPHAAGLLLEREVSVLSRLLTGDDHPFVAVLGGVKVSDKLTVIDALLTRCDLVLVGGAMAFTFLLAQGRSVGASLVQPDMVDECRRLLDTGRVHIPTDIVIAREPSSDAETRVVPAGAIPDGWMGLDVGSQDGDGVPRCRSTRRRACCGTGRWGCSRCSRSTPALGRSPRPSRTRPGSPSSAAATAPPPSASSGWPTRSTT